MFHQQDNKRLEQWSLVEYRVALLKGKKAIEASEASRSLFSSAGVPFRRPRLDQGKKDIEAIEASRSLISSAGVPFRRPRLDQTI